MNKILIIDDDIQVCENMREILEGAAYEVRTALDGKEGVYQVIEFQPDLIFCDIIMPNMDGFATIRMLQQKKLIGQCSFIFLSGVDVSENFRKCMQHGADDFLAKPFTPQEVLNTVKVRLQRQEELRHSRKELLTQYGTPSRYLSHELNTPLIGIIGGSQLLLDYGGEFTLLETEEMLSSIYESGQQLKTMIDKTLLYDSLMQGKMVFADTSSPVSAILGLLCERTSNEMNRSNDLELQIPETKYATNDEALSICIKELVENAFKFSKEGQKVIVKGIKTGERYTVSVSDFGHGMNMEQLDRIGPYRQFDREQHAQKGMGLGLAIVQRTGKLINAAMKTASVPGLGTTITLSL